jgi:predicted AAA+ superfamily ATPase
VSRGKSGRCRLLALQYFTDLIREDAVERSRLHELRAMRLFVELLRERAGSPLSLASIASDLGVSPTFDSKTPSRRCC